MTLDFQSLSTDTLLYMLMHSGIFVAIMGAVFFIIGLIFGYATWGRYKTKARVLAAEIDSQRQEIATLKRKVGEHNVKPGSAALVTETLPVAINGYKPPASTPVIAAAPDSVPPTVTVQADVKGADNTKPKRKSIIEPKTALEALPAVVAPPPSEDAAKTLAPAPTPSALASIITPHPVEKKEKPLKAAPTTPITSLDIIPALPELPPASQPPPVQPERDPKLGLIYKSRPADSDDLTAMKGIAKVLEQRLHEFGIYTYKQIAVWTDEQVKSSPHASPSRTASTARNGSSRPRNCT
jgi:predicted flap endonuclease-1-like 5' DNA nuclease